MKYIFTVCSNNYLAQAIVLGKSIKRFSPESTFVIFLCDQKHPRTNYNKIADEVLEIKDIEPDILKLAGKYNIIELNTAIKPTAAQYLFEKYQAEKVLYLDPDIKVFNKLDEIYTLLDRFNIVLSPHIYTPIPIDGKRPGENTFLNYGIYNLGFIALKSHAETMRMLSWWKGHTYEEGYIDPANGIFVDQLPMNHVPLFFKDVHILDNKGVNMAPWNLHERVLSVHQDGFYMVNNIDPLMFYHFSAMRVDEIDQSLINYGRFNLVERTDLRPMYVEYQQELIANGYYNYRSMDSSYNIQKREEKSEKKKKWYKRFLSKNGR